MSFEGSLCLSLHFWGDEQAKHIQRLCIVDDGSDQRAAGWIRYSWMLPKARAGEKTQQSGHLPDHFQAISGGLEPFRRRIQTEVS